MILTHPAHQSLIATRCPSSGMYLMSLTNPHSAPPSLTFPSTPTLQACSTRFNKGTNYLANNAFSMATNPYLAMYYHCATFSLVSTTLITAINNGKFSTCPVLTAELISKHLQKSLATEKGHDERALYRFQWRWCACGAVPVNLFVVLTSLEFAPDDT